MINCRRVLDVLRGPQDFLDGGQALGGLVHAVGPHGDEVGAVDGTQLHGEAFAEMPRRSAALMRASSKKPSRPWYPEPLHLLAAGAERRPSRRRARARPATDGARCPRASAPARRHCGHTRRPSAGRARPRAPTRRGTARRPCRSGGRSELSASLVCSVEKIRWPVRAERMAMSAVSASRISPTKITSGSWRRIDRRPVAKVRPRLGLTGIWLMPESSYSTGSSMVMIFLRGS